MMHTNFKATNTSNLRFVTYLAYVMNMIRHHFMIHLIMRQFLQSVYTGEYPSTE